MEEILTQLGEFSPLLVAGLGMSIGLQHAFEPDHVAAVGTQVSKGRFLQKSTRYMITSGAIRSSILGAFWGAGHTTTLVLMGLLVYAFAVQIQQQVFSGIELVVGIMLIFLAVTTILNKKIISLSHRHPHEHEDGTIHYDEHEHSDVNHKHGHKSYLIGCIHGLAGSGSLVVLTAATLNNVATILSFILIFGIGSILGMMLVSGLIGLPFVFSAKAVKISRILRYAAGAFSLVIGANIIYGIGMAENLLVP